MTPLPLASEADDAVNNLCDITRALLGAERVTVWLHDERTRTLTPSHAVSDTSEGGAPDSHPVSRIALEDHPAIEQALREGRGVTIDRAEGAGGALAWAAQGAAEGPSVRVEPLTAGSAVGLLAIEPAEAAQNGDLASIVPLVAMAVSHGIAWRESHRRRAEEARARAVQQRTAAALRELLTEGSRATSVEEAGDVLARAICDAIGTRHAVVLLRSEDEAIDVVATVGIHPVYHDAIRSELVGQPLAHLPLWNTFGTDTTPVFVEDASASDLLPAELVRAMRLTSYVAVPITVGGGLLGVLVCTRGGPTTWSEADRDLVAQLALEGSLVVENASLRSAERNRMLELAHKAFHDALTGLPNRTLFVDRLEHALLGSSRRTGACAVLFLDLDGFKTINDELGHEMGDELLVMAARRLEQCLRPGDTVARLGGDEFTILLEEVEDESDAVFVANRLIERFGTPFPLRDREVVVTTSVGIAIANDRGLIAHALLRRADLAMYRAKRMGKARFEIFREGDEPPRSGRLELALALRRAVENDELRLHYQPMVSLPGEELVGLEALVRWEHPERGLIAPGEFLPAAERNGLMSAIGNWVLEEACRQMHMWDIANPEAARTIWVNLSPRQFQHADLLPETAATLARYELTPGRLGFELTESVLIDDADRARRTLESLRSLGVRLAIDDFGTGYSSLSYLRHLPFDTLKIDRSFIVEIDAPANAAIVRSIIALAEALGHDVIAEGVETKQQVIDLRSLGCEVAQGHYFARPAPAADLEALLTPARRNGKPPRGNPRSDPVTPALAPRPASR